MQIWIIYSIIYAIFNGIYNCSKKKATEKSNLYVILPIMTLLSFLLVTLTTKDAFPISLNNLLVIFFKSLIISISWILNMYAIKKMTLSLYGIINISSIIFVQILSFMILKEAITINMMIGMFIIILGIVLVNIISNNKQTKETNITSIILLLFSCFLSAISCIIDKMILKNISSSQLQFWFLLFLSIIFGIILLNIIKLKKEKFKLNNNYWIIIMAIVLTIGDRFLFMANSNINSKASIIKLINEISIIETIILGKIFFKEEKILKKLLCTLLIIIGVIVVVM